MHYKNEIELWYVVSELKNVDSATERRHTLSLQCSYSKHSKHYNKFTKSKIDI